MRGRAPYIILLAVLAQAILAAPACAVEEIGALLLADWTANFVDSIPGAGTIFIQPLYGDTSRVFFNGPPLKQPYGVFMDPEGQIVIADRIATPEGITNGLGGVYGLAPVTLEILFAAGSDEFRALCDVDMLPDGSILVVDREANPLGHPTGDTGAVFRVDPVTAAVTLFSSPSEFVDPYGVLVDSTGAVYVVDENANPLGWPHDSGAIWEIDPDDGSLLRLVSSDSLLSTPLDAIRVGPHLYVIDKTFEVYEGYFTGGMLQIDLVTGVARNPVQQMPICNALVDVQFANSVFYLLDRDGDFDGAGGYPGGIYMVDPISWRAARHLSSRLWEEPQALLYIPTSRVLVTRHHIEDLNGARINPGDTLRVDLEIKSIVEVPTTFVLRDTIPDTTCEYVGGSATSDIGVTTFLHSGNRSIVIWTADLVPHQEASLSLRLTVKDIEPMWEVFTNSVIAQDDVGGWNSSAVSDTVMRGLRKTDIVIADPVSFFSPGQIVALDEHGVLLDVFPTFELLLNPTGVHVDAEGYVYVADRDADVMGDASYRGGVFRYSPTLREFTVFATNETWVDPAAVLGLHNGNIAVLDIAAAVGSGGEVGAIFELDRTTGEIVSTITSDQFVWPVAMALTPSGDILVVDRDANPGGFTAPRNGAVFRIKPDGRVLVDLISERFEDPVGISLINETEYLIADMSANPPGHQGNSGAIFRGHSGGGESVFTSDWHLDNPTGVAISRRGLVLIADAVAGTIFQVDLLESWRFSVFTEADVFGSPYAISTTPASRLANSIFLLSDFNGHNLVAGDPIRYELRIRNDGNIADEDVIVINDLPALADIIPTSVTVSAGEVEYDAALNQVRWRGPVTVLQPVSIFYRAIVSDRATIDSYLINSAHIIPAGSPEVFLADTAAVYGPFLSGDMLITDAGYEAPGGGTGALMRRNYHTGEPDPVFVGDPLIWPSAVVADRDRRALIVDMEADPYDLGGLPGAVFRYDGGLDELVTIASSSDFVAPVDLVLMPDGLIYVVDSDANPFDLQGAPGAVMRVDPDNGEITPIASDPRFRNPTAIALDLDGSLLVLDRDAQVSGYHGIGVLFRVDPSSGEVTQLVTNNAWRSCRDLLLNPDGDYIIIDQTADPEGYGGDHGAVFKVNRESLQVTVLSADEDLIDPVAGTWGTEGQLLLAEPGLPDRLVVWEIEPVTNRLRTYWESSELVGPVSLFVLDRPVLTASSWEVDDLNGPPVGSGDQLRYRLTLRNTSLVPGDPVWTSVVTSPRGELDPASIEAIGGWVETDGERIEFVSSVASGDSTEVRFLFTVSDGLGQGTRIVTLANIDAGNGMTFQLPDIQKIPFEYEPNDMLLLDRRANPENLPGVMGAIFKWDASDRRFYTLSSQREFGLPQSIMIDPDDPSVVYLVDGEADPRRYGGNTGAVFKIASGDGRIISSITSRKFVDPLCLFTDLDGNLILVDQGGDPDSVGNSGALFRIDRTSGEVSTVISHPSFVDPRGGAPLPDGGFIVIDRTANPHGVPGNVGTIFKVRPEQGVASVLLTGGFLVDPVGLAPMGDGTYVIVDENANPAGFEGNNGALFRYHPEGNLCELLSVSPLYFIPQAAKVGQMGEVYVVDGGVDPNGTATGRGAILRYHPSDGNVIVYAYGTELRVPVSIDFFESPTPVFVLELSATETDRGAIRLSWRLVASGEISGFDVYRRAAGSGSGSPEAEDLLTQTSLPPDARSFLDDTAEPGGTYDYWVGLTELDGAYTLSLAARITLGGDLPRSFALWASRPNPFGSMTAVGFDVPPPGAKVSVRIYDLAGRLVRRLAEDRYVPGRYVEPWDGRDGQGQQVAPGIYFCRMRAPNFSQTQRLVLIR